MQTDRSFLEANGYVVIRNVFPREQCELAREHFAKYQSRFYLPKVLQRSGGTRMDFIGGVHAINKYGGQHPFMKKFRASSRLAQIFCDLYDCESPKDLRASMDGFCYHRAADSEPAASARVADWAHVDQGLRKTPYASIQGQIILSDNTGPHSGGLVVWPKSHLFHAEALAAEQVLHAGEKNPPDFNHNFVKISESVRREVLEIHEGCVRTNVATAHQVKMGDVILWYSKTLHMYDPPTREAPVDRCVAYVTYCPAEFLTQKDIHNRAIARRFNRTTSHWPGAGFVKLNAKVPVLYKKERVAIFKEIMARPYDQESIEAAKLTKEEAELAAHVDGSHDACQPSEQAVIAAYELKCKKAAEAGAKRVAAKRKEMCSDASIELPTAKRTILPM